MLSLSRCVYLGVYAFTSNAPQLMGESDCERENENAMLDQGWAGELTGECFMCYAFTCRKVYSRSLPALSERMNNKPDNEL